jgi:site-specific DNA recombinase
VIRRKFDPNLALRFIFYGRMSDPGQNARSPEQQLDTCLAVLKRLGFPWVQVGTHIDRGISGRRIRGRPEFWRMITDIRSGKVKVDVIVVDTYERFGRADELDSLRRELANRYGVLVMTADSNFADPASVAGRVLGAFEGVRATEDGRIKAHNVGRGKRDAVVLGHWPGGKPPFGLRLENVMVMKDGREEVDHIILLKHGETNPIVARAFQIADQTGWGSLRCTRLLNADPNIPDEYKPISPRAVHRWLSNPIYYGELVWGMYCTDMIDDRRVIELADPADVLRVPNFCEPTVPKELFDRVQAIRLARRLRSQAARKAAQDETDKFIRPISPGLALKYVLTGLVRCPHCGRAMVISSSPEYVTKAGDRRRYSAYFCPASPSGICPNRARIPEEWLRHVVIDLSLSRLFSA